jgi:hypothetical protein
MGMLLESFLSMLMLVFAIASIIAGFFTAYFGSGKSRAVGAILIVIGLIVFVLFLWFAGILTFMGTAPMSFVGVVTGGIVAVVGAIVGALIALGIFLLAIMKA